MKIIRLLSIEWIKIKRTSVQWIVMVAPIIYSMIFLLYFNSRHNGNDIQVNIYESFYQLGSIALPILIGLISGIICEQESNAGNFNGMMIQNASRITIYLSKLLHVITLVIIILFGSTIFLLIGMKWMLQIESIHYVLFFQGAFLALVGALFLFPLHLYLGIEFGQGAAIGAGSAGFLIAAMIGTTTLGDSVWQYIPWAWSTRLSWCPILLMPEISYKLHINTNEIYMNYITKSIPGVIFFMVILIYSIIWFNKWQGRKSTE